MNFIKILIVSLFLLLTACGSLPEQQGNNGSNRLKQTIPEGAQPRYQQALNVIDQQNWPQAEIVLLGMQTQYPKLQSVVATLGWVYWQQEKTDLAIATLQPLIGDTTLYKPDAYNTLALIYREQGRFKEAETLYNRALAIWSNDADLHINTGILYDLYMGQLQKALAHYQTASELIGSSSSQKSKQLNGWIKDLERRTQ